jgi:cysteine desulfurase
MNSIYLDNNGSLKMSKKTIEYMCKWFNVGNPSADHESATAARKMIEQCARLQAKVGKFNYIPVDSVTKKCTSADYTVIFTSCGSEANSHIIRAIVDAKPSPCPHIIASAVEHKSILMCLEHLSQIGAIEYSLAPVDSTGKCTVESIEKLVNKRTVLITVMHANNETGCVNDIKSITHFAHSKGILFHTDCAQTWVKRADIDLPDVDVDAVSVTFHKCGGPIGVGALILKCKFLAGWKIGPLIAGTQNGGLRGGTENCAGIAGTLAGVSELMADRAAKNKKMTALKIRLIKQLRDNFPAIMTYQEYLTVSKKRNYVHIDGTVVLISGLEGFMPGTLLFAIIRTDPDKCNLYYKKQLEQKGIIVSIGSACNTTSKYASHVLDAIGANKFIKRSTLRISMCDETVESDIDSLVAAVV